VSEGDAASFEKPAAAYDRFVGRYGAPLARELIGRVGLEPDSKALDVGCGPGALTSALAEALGAERVAAIDPSQPFARACAERVPGADVRAAPAEAIPFADDSFDATLSQLVINFLADAPVALAEMRRVTVPGGPIAASVWDYAGEMTMLRAFWDAAIEIDPDAAGTLDEGARMPYARPEDLAKLWRSAGLAEIATDAAVVSAAYEDFDDLWDPFTAGVGPAGAYCASLPDSQRAELRAAFARRLGSPGGRFELPARAWIVSGREPAAGD
jgi:SAM-dependent methyltransferase